MKSIDKINEAMTPVANLMRDDKPKIVTNKNDISVTAPADFKLSRIPAKLANQICELSVPAPM